MSFIKNLAIVSLVCASTSLHSEEKISCFGIKQTQDALSRAPGGLTRESIEFEISEAGGRIYVSGANLPVNGFPITQKTTDYIYSQTKDQNGHTWFISFGRFTGEFNLFESWDSPLGQKFVPILIKDAICSKREKLM
jgi:hypothetical protein